MEVESSKDILRNMKMSYSRSTDFFTCVAEQENWVSVLAHLLSNPSPLSFQEMTQPMNRIFVLISLTQSFWNIRSLLPSSYFNRHAWFHRQFKVKLFKSKWMNWIHISWKCYWRMTRPHFSVSDQMQLLSAQWRKWGKIKSSSVLLGDWLMMKTSQ